MPKTVPADTWQNLFYPPPTYQYFDGAERFGFDPAGQQFSWTNAWWMADAALLAYVKDWNCVKAILTAPGRFDEAEQIGADPAKSTKGYVALRGGAKPCAVVAYRGTDKDDKRNAETDIDIVPLDRGGYIVHRGFGEALDLVWDSEVRPALDAFLAAHAGAPVFFTGHSLGAALATISAAQFAGQCSLYTIGSPRCGDSRFVKAVLAKAKVVGRFVNGDEIVTQIPTPPVYQHVGDAIYIDRTGVVRESISDLGKTLDVFRGSTAHDGAAAVLALGHPLVYFKKVMGDALVGNPPDPPPYIVGQHTPARYAVHIWNHLEGLGGA